MIVKFFWILFFIVSIGPLSGESRVCLSTREYITTVKYLEDHKEFELERSEILKMADAVSKGCSDSADRFVRVVNILLQGEIPAKTALTTGQKLAIKGKESTDAFILIFKSSYLQNLLDQDAKLSYQTAWNFADQFSGNLPLSADDFFQLANYCSEEGRLEIPKDRCLKVAEKVAKLTSSFNQSLSPVFIKGLEFMMDKENGPHLPLFSALERSEKIIEAGPLSTANFIEAYHWAVSKDGLQLSINGALDFAEKLALRSSEEVKKSSEGLLPGPSDDQERKEGPALK